MNRKKFSINKFIVTHKLSLGLLILGISCMIWAAFQILDQSSTITAVEINPITPDLITQNEQEVTPIIPMDPKLPPSSNEVISSEILYPIRPTKGDHIGNITIPAIDQIIPIFHGTDEDELEKGIGHFAQSVLPGENDNSVLSGHRDTVLRKLGQLEIKDQLIVQTSAGIFTYEVRKIQIVDRDDKTIISPTDHAVLTVTTCYPFTYIGNAPDRYILIADLVMNELE